MVALAKLDNLIGFQEKCQTKSNEWWTPYVYVEAAHQVMQGIDLDPASCPEANLVIRATRYFTREQDGLKQPWVASSVWLNPPYSSTQGTLGREGSRQGLAKPFIFKLIDEYKQGNVEQAILLVTSDTDASWFVPLWDYPICFADHKVMFHRPGRSNEGQFFGTSFIYFGKNEQKFVDTFSQFGPVTKRVSKPKSEPVNLSLWEVS